MKSASAFSAITCWMMLIVLPACKRAEPPPPTKGASGSGATKASPHSTSPPSGMTASEKGEESNAVGSSERASGPSWLPRAGAYDGEAAAIPSGTKIAYDIPKDDPLDVKTGWGRVDVYGHFVPTDKNSLTVKGGSFVSTVGMVTKRAKWGDWMPIYRDNTKKDRVGWGYCLTSGEVLLPRGDLDVALQEHFVENTFEVAPYGKDYVLITLDPAKGHKLCFMESEGAKVPTAGFVGSRVEIAGKSVQRDVGGWRP